MMMQIGPNKTDRFKIEQMGDYVRIDPATPDDLVMLLCLCEQFYHEFNTDSSKEFSINQTSRYLSSCLSKDNVCLAVAKDGNKIVGFIIGAIHELEWNEGKEANHQYIFVPISERKKGLGSDLVEYFLCWAINKGVQKNRVYFNFRGGIKDGEVKQFFDNAYMEKTGVIYSFCD